MSKPRRSPRTNVLRRALETSLDSMLASILAINARFEAIPHGLICIGKFVSVQTMTLNRMKAPNIAIAGGNVHIRAKGRRADPTLSSAKKHLQPRPW
ncbi:unnamed protein product [Phaeothamnion confervicola]